MLGQQRATKKFVVSRFPADQGVLAETHGTSLSVQFIERIFLKSATAYKAARYSGSSFDSHFWDGQAVDKQIGNAPHRLANYWIHGFLLSDFAITPAAGTRRLARALADAIKAASTPDIRDELMEVTVHARRRGGQPVSVRRLASMYHLSDAATSCIIAALPHDGLADETFVFDSDEFKRNTSIRKIDLDTGISVIGPTENFQDHVKREPVKGDRERFRFETTGRVTAEQLRKR